MNMGFETIDLTLLCVLGFSFLGVMVIGWAGFKFATQALLPALTEINYLRQVIGKGNDINERQTRLLERLDADLGSGTKSLLVRVDEVNAKIQVVETVVRDIDDILGTHEHEAKTRHTLEMEEIGKISTLIGTTSDIVGTLPKSLAETQNLIQDAKREIMEGHGRSLEPILSILGEMKTALGNNILNLTTIHNALAKVEAELVIGETPERNGHDGHEDV